MDQQEKKKKRETFSIGWLKPLQVTANIYFIFFWQKATVLRTDEIQELYFDGYSKGVVDLIVHTLFFMAYKYTSQIVFRMHSGSCTLACLFYIIKQGGLQEVFYNMERKKYWKNLQRKKYRFFTKRGHSF
jgi:hypothetical protein